MLQSETTPGTRLRGIGVRARQFTDSHQDLLLLLLLFVSLRLSLLVISRPQGYLHDGSDYDFYLDLGRMSDRGLYPVLQYWTEYPPIFPWISVLAYRITEAIPNPQAGPILWFRLTLGTFLLLFDIGNLILVYLLGRELQPPPRAARVAWSYALLFTPLHVWLGWFDTLPLFFLLLGVTLAVRGRYVGAALVGGLGFMIKLIPLLTLPLLVKAEERPLRRLRLLAAAALAAVAVATPFLVSSPQYLTASFQSMFSRSPWETPWAIIEDYYGYGQVAPLEDRVDPATATLATYDSHLPWLTITAAFGVLYFFLWTRRFDPRPGKNVVAFTGLTVNLFLLYSRGYSPQFLVYLVPFALLVLPPLRAAGYLVGLGAINLLEYPVYGVLFPEEHWLLRDLVALRTVFFLLLSWEYLVALDLVPSLERARKVAAAGSLCAFALWSALTLPAAGQEWIASSIDHSPDAPVVDYLLANAGPDSVVVFTEQWLYRELYPYLYRHTNLRLVDPTKDTASALDNAGGQSNPMRAIQVPSQLSQLSGRFKEIYGVHHVSDRSGRRLEQLLAYQNRFEAARQMKELTISRWNTDKR